jgi:hypothetical protein
MGLSVICSLVYDCLKIFFQQQRLIKMEFESDWELQKAMFYNLKSRITFDERMTIVL